MELKEIEKTLDSVFSLLSEDSHPTSCEEGWASRGAILAIKEVGTIYLKASADTEGSLLFEVYMHQHKMTEKLLRKVNDYNLNSIFRASVDEEENLIFDFMVMNIKSLEEIQQQFTYLIYQFTSAENSQLLRAFLYD